MKEHSELFIGLDVSKLKTSVALAEDGRNGVAWSAAVCSHVEAAGLATGARL